MKYGTEVSALTSARYRSGVRSAWGGSEVLRAKASEALTADNLNCNLKPGEADLVYDEARTEGTHVLGRCTDNAALRGKD